MKNLYQLNLFSNKYCYENSDSKISINTIIKNIVPKMKTPEIVEDYIKKESTKKKFTQTKLFYWHITLLLLT